MREPSGRGIQIDRAAILAEVYARNALRIEVCLPRLNIRHEYEHAIYVRAWRVHVHRHHDRVQQEVLERQRAKFGQSWPESWGGRVGLNVMVDQALRAIFVAPL